MPDSPPISLHPNTSFYQSSSDQLVLGYDWLQRALLHCQRPGQHSQPVHLPRPVPSHGRRPRRPGRALQHQCASRTGLLQQQSDAFSHQNQPRGRDSEQPSGVLGGERELADARWEGRQSVYFLVRFGPQQSSAWTYEWMGGTVGQLGDKATGQKIELFDFGVARKAGQASASAVDEDDSSSYDGGRPLVQFTWRCATWVSLAQRDTIGCECSADSCGTDRAKLSACWMRPDAMQTAPSQSARPSPPLGPAQGFRPTSHHPNPLAQAPRSSHRQSSRRRPASCANRYPGRASESPLSTTTPSRPSCTRTSSRPLTRGSSRARTQPRQTLFPSLASQCSSATRTSRSSSRGTSSSSPTGNRSPRSPRRGPQRSAVDSRASRMVVHGEGVEAENEKQVGEDVVAEVAIVRACWAGDPERN